MSMSEAMIWRKQPTNEAENNERIDEQKENLEDLGGVFVELLLQ